MVMIREHCSNSFLFTINLESENWMVILQNVVVQQDGELECVQAKGMIGGIVTAKFDLSKAKGLPKGTLY